MKYDFSQTTEEKVILNLIKNLEGDDFNIDLYKLSSPMIVDGSPLDGDLTASNCNTPPITKNTRVVLSRKDGQPINGKTNYKYRRLNLATQFKLLFGSSPITITVNGSNKLDPDDLQDIIDAKFSKPPSVTLALPSDISPNVSSVAVTAYSVNSLVYFGGGTIQFNIVYNNPSSPSAPSGPDGGGSSDGHSDSAGATPGTGSGGSSPGNGGDVSSGGGVADPDGDSGPGNGGDNSSGNDSDGSHSGGSSNGDHSSGGTGSSTSDGSSGDSGDSHSDSEGSNNGSTDSSDVSADYNNPGTTFNKPNLGNSSSGTYHMRDVRLYPRHGLYYNFPDVED